MDERECPYDITWGKMLESYKKLREIHPENNELKFLQEDRERNMFWFDLNHRAEFSRRFGDRMSQILVLKRYTEILESALEARAEFVEKP